MFETDPNIALSGIAFRNKINADHNRRIAESNGRIAAGWERTALEVAEQRDKALAELADAQARIAELELALAVKTASAAGSVAVVEAFKVSHPQSPLLAQDGVFRNGAVRRRSNVIWAKAFDETARKLGISNPLAHRIS